MHFRSSPTKIFLDSGDPNETREIIKLLGSLDGQTTNPTLIAKNPDAAARLSRGEKFTKDEIYAFYKEVVTEISHMIPQGSVSIEVYADHATTSEQMVTEGKQMFSWIPNAHIKLPTTVEGLKAAHMLVKKGIRVNMTLCFSQAQAAAVHAATKNAKRGDIFVSPFVGRLDDIGMNGMDLIKNIIQMYRAGDNHVEVLTASVRNLDHLLYALALESDIITAPYNVLKAWGEAGKPLPDASFNYAPQNLSSIPYQNLNLENNWTSFDISHDLTDKVVTRFSEDWNKLIT